MLIVCRVAPTERDAWSIAHRNLRNVLFRASQRDWPIELTFTESALTLGSVKPLAGAISLLPSVLDPREPPACVAENLRREAQTLCESGVAVFLCTVFRACEDPMLLERIRRLNLLAAEVSQETGAAVIDFDRHFADIGARTLQTNYLLGGEQASQFAGKIIADALLAAGFDESVPVDVLQLAQGYVT